MDSWVRDLRLAARFLRRSPAFAAAAALLLGLGVGVNTALFGVVDAVLLRPLPFSEPDRLVFVTREGDVSLLDGADWRAACPSLEEVALFLRSWSFDLVGSGEPIRVNGAVAEPRYFRVFRTPPRLGRVLLPEDDRLGAPMAVVLSHGFWQRHFGADHKVVGRALTLSDVPATVVGVMPPEFDFLNDQVDFWTSPAVATPWALPERGTNNFDAVARLRPGATLEQARAELLAVSRRLEAEYPRTNRGKIVDPLPLQEFLVGRARPALLVLSGAVGLVLVVASLNLAGLLLARSTARREEFALRLALGAGRARLFRQVLSEGMLLGAAGAVLGLLLSVLVKHALLGMSADAVPRAWEIRTDGRALLFGLVAAVAAGLLSSLVPAWQALRRAPAGWLRGRAETAGGGGRGLLGALVALEIAMAFVLLVGSGLLLRTFWKLQAVPLGFDPAGVLKAEVVLPESRYGTREAQTRFFREVVERVSARPGVEAAGFALVAPLSPRGGVGGRLVFVDPPPVRPEETPGARIRAVHGDYFQALRQPIVAGRVFTAEDHASAEPVAIVNERFAREFWPDRSPVGQRLAFRDHHDGKPFPMTIVGVAADVKGTRLDQEDDRALYTPYEQRRVSWQRFGTFVVRTRSDAAGFVPALQQAVWAVDPAVPLDRVETLAARVRSQLAPPRFNALALALFAAVALAIAVQGLYALLAYAVALRRREIGVRLALGARGRDVARLVVGGGLGLAVAGLAAGLAASFCLERAVRAVLFEVEAVDPPTYLLVAAALLATAVLSSALPARRAARIDPMATLRCE
jgi:putative ABC transport system permease protein